MIQNLRTKRKRKDSERNGSGLDTGGLRPEINFFQMPVNTLRRYKRHYKLQTRPGLNKAQLADVSQDEIFILCICFILHSTIKVGYKEIKNPSMPCHDLTIKVKSKCN